MKLYDYWRSSAAYRVRIALNVKGIDYESISIPLIGPGGSPGKQFSEEYLAMNPQGRVPFLDDGKIALGQSQAILEYIEEAYPDTPLLPGSAIARAHVRSFCNLIACDIHPLNNSSVMVYLKKELDVSDEDYVTWYGHWIRRGFRAGETFAKEHSASGEFVFGDSVTLADCFLVPQMYNAHRFNVVVDDFPTLNGIVAACNKLTAFAAAIPEAQPDAS